MGRVSGVYGVRGWLRVRSDCEPAEQLLAYSPWQLKTVSGWRSHVLEEGKAHGPGLVAKLATVDAREQARQLVGADIAVDRSQLPALAQDDYYWHDLIGFGVVTRDGEELGRVTGLMQTGANDVLVVNGERERLIPFIREQVVLAVDAQARRIEVDWDPDF
ncbi:MAG: ribosome maturation factor RimM [Gammaproteobacteria bacterium]|nr:MAG: ribosome maturation factor RimM [Gammaproteobacteria bacterium]